MLGYVRERLDRTTAASRKEGAYHSETELYEDLSQVEESLRANGTSSASLVRRLMRQVSTFGLHLAKLDLRQSAARHTEALSEITRELGLAPYGERREAERVEWLTSELSTTRPLLSEDARPSEATSETLDVFRVARRALDERARLRSEPRHQHGEGHAAVLVSLKRPGLPGGGRSSASRRAAS
jgi:phosphoenolpyruvate carboxylase